MENSIKKIIYSLYIVLDIDLVINSFGYYMVSSTRNYNVLTYITTCFRGYINTVFSKKNI